MTELPATIGTVPTDTGVVAELAEKAAARQRVDVVDGRAVGFILNAGQSLETIDLDEYADAPARKQGTAHVTNADSFVTYVDRHSLTRATTLWGNIDAGTVTAVLDDHVAHADTDTPGEPGWGQHRAVLTLRKSVDWQHWLKADGKFLTQTDFAEHIEDGVDAIVRPDAATMLEIAQTFQARTGAQIDSGKRLGGEVQFTYTEQTSAGAGEHGSIEIPDSIDLMVAPFEGADPYPLKARFRFRVNNGQLALGYRLIRPDRILREAFNDIAGEIAAASGFPIIAGTPRSA